MSLDRRTFLRVGGWLAAGAAASACSPLYARLADPFRPSLAWPADIPGSFRALQRLTFGPTAAERLAAASMGVSGWIEEQLAPRQVADTAAELLVRPFDSLSLEASDLAAWDRDDVVRELRRATILRQVYSRRQLYEVMVEFWTDHFNVSVEKGDCWFLKTVDDRQVIRAHALGNFRDLLWGSAHSPAMLVYLDNQANLKDAPNENYARELMELHTLGVHGGYGQGDVMELARCLTGWSVRNRFWLGDFVFQPDFHDPGWKDVLRVRVEPAGVAEAEGLLDVLALHPSTAQHLARKLVQRFVGETVGRHAELVARVARAFLESRGDIVSTLRALLLDVRFEEEAEPKFKRPVNYLLSALRMLDADTDGGADLLDRLSVMGQLPFAWATPDGPTDEAAPWKGGLLSRWQFALDLMTGKIGGTRVPLDEWMEAAGVSTPDSLVDRFGSILLGSAPDETTRAALLSAATGSEDVGAELVVAGLLSSPAFQWR